MHPPVPRPSSVKTFQQLVDWACRSFDDESDPLVIALGNGDLDPRDPETYGVAERLGIVDQAVAAGRLILTAAQSIRHRRLKRAQGKRRVKYNTGQRVEWLQNRRRDQAMFEREYGPDSTMVQAGRRLIRQHEREIPRQIRRDVETLRSTRATLCTGLRAGKRRESRPGRRRRAGASSRTSSADPGAGESEPPARPALRLVRAGEPVAEPTCAFDHAFAPPYPDGSPRWLPGHGDVELRGVAS